MILGRALGWCTHICGVLVFRGTVFLVSPFLFVSSSVFLKMFEELSWNSDGCVDLAATQLDGGGGGGLSLGRTARVR